MALLLQPKAGPQKLPDLVADPFPSALILERGDDELLNYNTMLCDELSIFKSIISEPGLAFLFPFLIGGNRHRRMRDLSQVTPPEIAKDQDSSPICDSLSDQEAARCDKSQT